MLRSDQISLRSDSGYEGSTLFGKIGRHNQNKGHYVRSPHLNPGEQYMRTPVPHDYRDYAASTVSELESMPDQSFQATMNMNPDSAIDPNLERSQALLGVGVEHIGPFDQMALADGPVITPPYDFTNIPQPDLSFNYSHNNEPLSPWTMNSMKRSHPSQHHQQQGSRKRVHIQLDSHFPHGEPTPPSHFSSSNDPRSPRSLNHPYSPQNPMYPNPNMTHFNSYDTPAFAQQQTMESVNQSVAPEPPTSAPQTLQAPPSRKQAKPKAPRRNDKKHLCTHCGPDKTFSTSNDLDRHLKTVHGIIPEGEKVWLCKLPGCNVSAKVWARLDNFKQHVIRMHGGDFADQADDMAEVYNAEIHGPVDVGPKRHRAAQHANQQPAVHTSGAMTEPGFDASPVTSPQHQFPSVHGRRSQQMPTQAYLPLASSGHILRSGNTSMANQGHRSFSTVSMAGTAQSTYVQPHLLQAGSSQRMPPRRTAPRTVANPETVSQQKQYLQEDDATSANFSYMPSSSADFRFMGEQHGQSHGRFNNEVGNQNAALQTTQEDGKIQLETAIPRMPDHLTATINAYHDSLPREHRREFEQIYRQILSSFPSETSQQRSDKSPKALNETKADVAKVKIHSCSKKVIVDGIEKDCNKSFDKKSELKKHESRHLRKYGCTFDHCYKRFGTKWEWKRHEHNQHVQLEGWRCMTKGCEQHFDDKKGFVAHLQGQHKVEDEDVIQAELDASHLEKMWFGSFWCGFCNKIVRTNAAWGVAMEDERNAHVSKHIDSGIDGKKCDMWDWVELKAIGRNKRQMRELHRDVKNLQPQPKDKVPPEEVNDDSSSDEEIDAPGEDDPSPPTNPPKNVEGDAQSRQETKATTEKRRASAPNPTIVVSPAEDEHRMSAFHGRVSRQRQQSSPEVGHDMYTMNQVSNDYECAGCRDPFCSSCELKGEDMSSLQPSEYSEFADDMDMF